MFRLNRFKQIEIRKFLSFYITNNKKTKFNIEGLCEILKKNDSSAILQLNKVIEDFKYNDEIINKTRYGL